MKRPDAAIEIIKDICDASGPEVEGYINYLEGQLCAIREALQGYHDSDLISLAETTYRLHDVIDMLKSEVEILKQKECRFNFSCLDTAGDP